MHLDDEFPSLFPAVFGTPKAVKKWLAGATTANKVAQKQDLTLKEQPASYYFTPVSGL